MMDFDYINEISAFADGDLFLDEGEIRDYFTVENFDVMFSPSYLDTLELTQEDLTKMADVVIENKWHILQTPALDELKKDMGFEILNKEMNGVEKIVIGVELFKDSWNLVSFDEQGGANSDQEQGSYSEEGLKLLGSTIKNIYHVFEKALKEFKTKRELEKKR